MASASFPLHLLPPPNPSFLSFHRNLLPYHLRSHHHHHHHHHLATSASCAVDQPSTRAERHPRKKKNNSSTSAETTTSTPKSTSKRPGRPKKSPPPPPPPPPPRVSGSGSDAESDTYSDLEFDDGIDFPYEDPPLVCCFGGLRREFLPTVRVHDNPMHPDIYSQWKMLQWDPPEFSRAPGGPASNVAVAHVRLGGRAAVLGKVGGDLYGDELVLKLNQERVQTRGIRFESKGDGEAIRRTGCSRMRVKEMGDGRMGMEVVRNSPEDSLLDSELNLGVLKEARVFHFASDVLTSADMQLTLFKAIRWSKKFGGLVFFDLNLPLPLWRSRDETKEVIKKAWREADIIEVSRQELEFLLDEDYYERKRNYRPQYYAENYEQTRNRRNCYHYTREEISPLWHDKLKFLFVTDGTLRIHYYAPGFDGVVVGTEDVLITPFTCDRTGSGDAVVAAILRKLTTHPQMYSNQDYLERQLRFAIAAGIIAQWTIGAVRGFPTESATQNLKEQVYVPSMW